MNLSSSRDNGEVYELVQYSSKAKRSFPSSACNILFLEYGSSRTIEHLYAQNTKIRSVDERLLSFDKFTSFDFSFDENIVFCIELRNNHAATSVPGFPECLSGKEHDVAANRQAR